MSLNENIQTMMAGVRNQVPEQIFTDLDAMFRRLSDAGVASHPPAVGEHAPGAAFVDSSGTRISLGDLYAERPLVLLFYRGGWCPVCDLTLRAYDEVRPQIEALGAHLVGVSPQTDEASRATGESRSLSFPLLRDPENAAARRFGLAWRLTSSEKDLYGNLGADVATANGNTDWELPAPAVFVIDRAGIVRFSWADANWTLRAEPETVVAALHDMTPTVFRGGRDA